MILDDLILMSITMPIDHDMQIKVVHHLAKDQIFNYLTEKYHVDIINPK